MKYVGSATNILPTSGARTAAPRTVKDGRFSECIKDVVARERTAKSAATSRGNVHQVLPGDTLWGIVRERMLAAGHEPTNAEILAGVEEVAALNGIENSDLIYPEQEIRFGIGETEKALGPIQKTASETSRNVASFSTFKREVAATENALHPPVAGVISSGFGLRRDPFDHELKEHRGVDFAAPAGTPVAAALPGVVAFSGWRNGYGNVVILEHELGLRTVYAHNQSNLVKTGEKVADGALIARVGSTGRSTAPHLHFEVVRGGQQVDPLTLLYPRKSPFIEQIA